MGETLVGGMGKVDGTPAGGTGRWVGPQQRGVMSMHRTSAFLPVLTTGAQCPGQ